MRQRGGSGQPVEGRRTNRPKARKVSAEARSIADPQKQVGTLTRELKEANERQTATAEVLQVINSSPGNLAPVFETILEKAHSLCGVSHGSLQLYDGEKFRAVAVHGIAEAFADRLRQGYVPGPNHPSQRLLQGERFAQVPDWAEIDDPTAAATLDAGIRTTLFMPLRREESLLGYIGASRPDVKPFTEKEIALLESFAAQAVIAIENARLITETREALERQTATTEVLQVINSSPGDLAPVFEIILEKAHSLCAVAQGALLLYDGEKFRAVAVRGLSEALAERLREGFIPGPNHPSQRLIKGARFDQVPDGAEIDDSMARATLDAGVRTTLFIPLRREGKLLGHITASRPNVRPFTEKEISLLESFAAQAVIAMENARLFEEVQAKTRDLEESLQQQTATSEVLQIISSSPGDLTPVFDKMLENATQVCGAKFGSMVLVEGDMLRQVALYNAPPELAAVRTNQVRQIHPSSAIVTSVRDKRAVEVEDIRRSPAYLARAQHSVELAELGGARTMVVVPMLRDNQAIGVITVYRQEVRPFSAKQIDLLTNFARQAVIAIENARLLKELRQRTDDLTEALTYQTGSANILKVIASSPTNVEPVLTEIVKRACVICEAEEAHVALRDGDELVFQVLHGSAPVVWKRQLINRLWVTGRAAVDRRPVHVHDLLSPEGDEFPDGRELARRDGARTVLAVPLLRESGCIGVIALRRMEVRPFSEKQIELLQTFADQAVIAIGNVHLFDKVQARTRELAESLEQQTATSGVLEVISSSPGELEPVFQALLENATRLCQASYGVMWLREGNSFRCPAIYGPLPPAYIDQWRSGTLVHPTPHTGLALVTQARRAIQIPDLRESRSYLNGEPLNVSAVEVGGVRTLLLVPMFKEDDLVGVIAIYRQEVRTFTDNQIDLVTNFAKQAVIAIENTRLLNELRQSLQQQSATADVLKVISRSTFDLHAVLQTLVDSAAQLCDADKAFITRQRDGAFYRAEAYGLSSEIMDLVQDVPIKPERGTAAGRALLERHVVHISDVTVDPEYTWVQAQRLGDFHTILAVPMLREGTPIGVLILMRSDVRPFADNQIELVTTFADQAVIAIQNVKLFEDVQARTRELQESLEQQTATSNILQVISSSPGELKPVFQALLENATRVCGANFGTMLLYDGDNFENVALQNVPPAFARARENKPFRPHPRGPLSDLVRTKQVVTIDDLRRSPAYLEGNPTVVELADVAGARTVVIVPMLKDAVLIGAITLYRREVRPFGDKQIELVSNFAKQAVIAIENTRLLRELRQRTEELSKSLEQQTATADVLKVISSSFNDLNPVFEAIGQRAEKLCNAEISVTSVLNDDQIHLVSIRGTTEEGVEAIRCAYPMVRDDETLMARAIRYATICHVPDVLSDPLYQAKDAARTSKYRAGLAVPMIREGEVIGAIWVGRHQPGRFTDAQVQLLKTFADQAVIAIENARLFEELRERQDDLARSVDELTATSDVLKIISRSTVDLNKVLDTLVETAARLCHADQTQMFRRQGDRYRAVASCGAPPEFEEWLSRNPMPTTDRGTATARAAAERRTVHIADVLADPEYTWQEGQRIGGYRTVLAVPLLRGDTEIGLFALLRTRVEPFTDKEIELANTFADQAVIAIENARLFEELSDRQAELRVTFDNMGDGVAMFGADARLTAWNRNFQTILDLPDELIAQRPTYVEYVRILAERGEFGTDDIEGELNRRLQDTDREMRLERTRPDGRVIEVRRSTVPDGGFVLIYADVTQRKRAEQAIRAARDAAETALRELQKTQASLIHAQKMAALGQLTAGIAHEIKNPLNFVNNFAGLSVELLEELKEAATEAIGTLDASKRSEILETIRMLTGNLERIAEHGRRADGIVRGMLQHSRGSTGDWQATDLNALVEESLNLAYHGARAQDQDFKVTLELDLDHNLAPIEVVSQDVSRVLLNLVSNGFYAVTRRSREGDSTYRPTLKVTTREFGEGIEIRVRDNGMGIPLENRDKLFQPFFTTKPTGEGTGLGLSISYEIITQQHGGTITVDSEVGDFTEFTVRLPRRGHRVA